jgi:alpha/beta superfamily hydrolase
MKPANVTFENANGNKLSARLDFPSEEPAGAYAVFAHCFTCTKNYKAVYHISKALTGKGIAVFRFDFTGLGESEGDFSSTGFSSNVSDLVAAADFLEHSYAAPKLLIGHSFGGTACLHAAVRIPSVTAVVTIGSPANPGHVKHLLAHVQQDIHETGEAEVLLAGRPFRIKKQFLEDLEKESLEELLPKLNRALMVLHSPADRIVGIENASRIYKTAKHPKSFISLDDADHMVSDAQDSRWAGSIIAQWAAKYIRARS